MTDDRHDIPAHLIPSGEHVIANDHETEQIEENGQLNEPLCPHCGEPYEKGDDGRYIHSYRPVDGEWGEWEPDGRGGLYSSTEVEPSTWCDSVGEKHRASLEPFGYDGF